MIHGRAGFGPIVVQGIRRRRVNYVAAHAALWLPSLLLQVVWGLGWMPSDPQPMPTFLLGMAAVVLWSVGPVIAVLLWPFTEPAGALTIADQGIEFCVPGRRDTLYSWTWKEIGVRWCGRGRGLRAVLLGPQGEKLRFPLRWIAEPERSRAVLFLKGVGDPHFDWSLN